MSKKLSDELYNDCLHFQAERKSVIDAYEKTVSDLEDKKGSRFYTEELTKAKNTRDEALNALKSKYGGFIDSDIKNMREVNGKRGIEAPNEEDVRTLEALKMRDTITEPELSLIANSLKGNALALSVVQEVALKNGIMRNYNSLYEGATAPVQYVEETLNSCMKWIRDFLNSDEAYAARIARDSHARLYGLTGDEAPLPKRPLFDTKEAFYNDIIGISGDSFKAFCNAVDGGEDGN